MKKRFWHRIAVLSCLAVASCSSDSGDDNRSESNGAAAGGVIASDGSGEKLTTSCGVLVDGKLFNPVATGDGEPAQVTSIVDSNLVIADVDGEPQLIKLHGLGGTTGFDNTAAKATLQSLAAEPTFFFDAGDCKATVVGGEARVGQLVTASGKSFGETVVRRQEAGQVETAGTCGEASISACLQELGSRAEAVEPAPALSAPKKQAGNFLWKPHSESPYNPGGVSILTNPCGVKVLVNGEEIRDYGATNGRCITARSANSGCSYGTNIKVELIDTATNTPVYFGDTPHIIIPNGCDRVEFAGDGSATSEPSGEEVAPACTTAPANAQYRASYPACDGNAAVILTGELAGAFSVQLRLSTGSDRLDESCSSPQCSPYKVQRYIDGDGVKTACFGAPGDAVLMNDVVHTSVKMAPDDSTPERFCISNPAADVN